MIICMRFMALSVIVAVLILFLGGCMPKVKIDRPIMNADGTDCQRHPLTNLCLKEKVRLPEGVYLAEKVEDNRYHPAEACAQLTQEANVVACMREATNQVAMSEISGRPKSDAEAWAAYASANAKATRQAQASLGTAALNAALPVLMFRELGDLGARNSNNTVTNNVGGGGGSNSVAGVTPDGGVPANASNADSTGPTSINTTFGNDNVSMGENNGTFTIERPEDNAINRPEQHAFEAEQNGDIGNSDGNDGINVPVGAN